MAKEDLYYIPSKEDYERDPYYYNTSFGRKKNLYTTKNMPILPVNPSEVKEKVFELLVKFGNVISDKAEEQVESFVKLFNWCIKLNDSPEVFFRLVHAAQTGSAKSLTLKVYVSMLKKESSLIVVSKVDEALSYCKTINELSNDKNYARCYYSVTDKNKDSALRVDNYKLKDYKCIVISHAMFQNLNYGDSLDTYKLYNEKQRDLVVVDEKVNFYRATQVTHKEIVELERNLFKHLNEIKLDSKYIDLLAILDWMLSEYMPKEVEDRKLKLTYMDLQVIKEQFESLPEQLKIIKELVESRLNYLFDEIYALGKVKSSSLKNSALKNVNDLLDRLSVLLDNKDHEHSTYYYQTNYEKIFFRVENIVNKLGNCVILDATATVNEFYKLAYLHSRSILDVYAEPTRKYENLTIYKSKGFRQGRSSLYKGLPKADIVDNAKMYLSYATNTMISSEDKLLIITHKGFKPYLEKECDDSRIRFTHWGNHVGKNDWSDCNIVMIVGWYFISSKEHLFSAFNAVDNEQVSFIGINEEVMKDFSTTQVADDIIQGVMRSRARNVITLDGDCKKTEVYIFYEDIKEYNEVLNIVEKNFPKCKVLEYKHSGIAKKVKETIGTKNANVVLNYLSELEQTNNDVLLKDVVKELDMKSYQMSRILKSEYFKEQLDLKGYKLKNSDGKSKYFILK